MPGNHLEVQPRDLGIGSLFETVWDAVIVAEATEGLILLWNPAAADLFGYSTPEAPALRLEDLVPGLRDAGGRYPVPGEPLILPAARKDGGRLEVEMSLNPIQPVRKTEGDDHFLLAIARDVTRREKDEGALREAQELFKSAFENAPIGVAVVGLDGRFLRVNRSLCETLGFTEEELLSTTFQKITHPDDLDASMANVRRVMAGEMDRYSLEKRYVGAGGRTVWVSLSVSLVRDQKGEPLYFVDQIEDVTEQREAAQQLALRAEELARANAELEQFSYSVSHDLRAPLRAIDGYSRILLEDFAEGLDEEGKDYLTRVQANSQRMGVLIDDLLELSRITRSPLRNEEVDLSGLASSILGELQGNAPERRVEAEVEKGLVVNGDPGLLRVALENLLGNAWKFTSREPEAKIEFDVTERDGHRAYYVRDNGAGFEMAYADKLFAPFQRLHGADEFEGTGIGLATVQRVIHRHGGQVRAESEPGEGATFYFTL
jgi:PAS domain S-box-containing protein